MVRGGRLFSRRLISLLQDLGPGKPRIRLTNDFHLDIDWWSRFAATFNGQEKIIFQNFGSGPILFTDSCPQGYGILCDYDWQAGYFNSQEIPTGLTDCDSSHDHWLNVDVVADSHISCLELKPVYLALLRYAASWRNQHVLFMTDNTQVVSSLNKGTSANTYTMSILRDIFWVCVTHNIYLCARHLPGETNIIPDRLSCIRETGSLTSLQQFSICCSGLDVS